MAKIPVDAVHLRDLARLRRVRDRTCNEYAQPLNVEALAHVVYTHRSATRFFQSNHPLNRLEE